MDGFDFDLIKQVSKRLAEMIIDLVTIAWSCSNVDIDFHFVRYDIGFYSSMYDVGRERCVAAGVKMSG